MTPLLFESLLDGLLQGLVYAIAAVGLTLIFGVMKVVNLAHGAFVMLGMFGLYLASSELGINPYLAVPLVALGGFVVGIGVYYLAVRRLHDSPELMSLLSTFAVSIMLIGLATSIFSTTPRNVPNSLGAVEVAGVRLVTSSLVAGAIALVLVAGLYVFLERVAVGKQIRAVADSRHAAEIVGVPSMRRLALAFAIGTLLAVASGSLIGTLFPFTVLSGTAYELKSFVIVVLGGMGNVTGALAGGLVLGAIEGIVPVYLSVSWTPVIEFAFFVAVLVLRPRGLFGSGR